jgi:S1-C subfamily serine protease
VNRLHLFRGVEWGRTLAKVDRVVAPLVVEPPQEEVDGASPHGGRRRPERRVLVAVVLVLAVVALALFALTRGPDTPPVTSADVNRAVQDGIAKAQDEAAKAPPDATTAYQAALPSLVTIHTRRASKEGAERGTGAGVVISSEGSVLTALHVVEGASSVQVTFSDGTESTATVQEEDASSDIAVLTPHRLPQVVVPAVMGGGVQVGDPVFALGHPLGLVHSLSAGVVSALDRSIRVKNDQTLEGLIQFDAAVNPGNSGGPLLNKAGQVVGIVTGLANPSEQNFFVGIGFAVPIATAGGVAGSPPQ